MSRDMGLRAWDGEQFLYFSPMTLAIDAVEGEGLLENASAVYALIRKAGRLDADRSTGLRDKNDITIFEGDILSVTHQKYRSSGDMRFYSNGFPNRLVQWRTSPHHNGWNVYDAPQTQFEIVGNVHQNPELAEVRS